jgi:hypothetical protein
MTQVFDDELLNQLAVCILNAVESQVVDGEVVLSLVSSFDGKSFMDGEGEADGGELQPEVTGAEDQNQAALAIQNKHRQKQAKAKVEEIKENHKAANSIQNKHRQKQAKVRVDMIKEKRANDQNVNDMADDESEKSQAAMAIQNKHRQRQAKERVESIKRDNKGATVIQNKHRCVNLWAIRFRYASFPPWVIFYTLVVCGPQCYLLPRAFIFDQPYSTILYLFVYYIAPLPTLRSLHPRSFFV